MLKRALWLMIGALILAGGLWAQDSAAGKTPVVTLLYSGNTMGFIQPCER